MTTNRPPDPPWLWPVLRIKADLWINSKTISILLREPVLTKLRQRLGLGGCRLSGSRTCAVGLPFGNWPGSISHGRFLFGLQSCKSSFWSRFKQTEAASRVRRLSLFLLCKGLFPKNSVSFNG